MRPIDIGWAAASTLMAGAIVAALTAEHARAAPPIGVTECVGALLPLVYERGVSTPDEYATALGAASAAIPSGWTVAAGGGLTPLDGRPVVSVVLCRQR